MAGTGTRPDSASWLRNITQEWLKDRIIGVAKHWTIGVVDALAVVAQ